MRESEALLAARRAASTSDSVALRIIEVSPTRSNKESKSAENGTVRLNILMQACALIFCKMDERGETCSPRTEKALAAAPPPPEPPPAPSPADTRLPHSSQTPELYRPSSPPTPGPWVATTCYLRRSPASSATRPG